MAFAAIEKAVVWEGSTPVLMARVVGSNNIAIKQADLNNVDYRVDEAGTQIVDTTALTIADVIFDTLQTTTSDAAWTRDNTGYNFRHQLAAADLPDGDTTYLVQFRFKDAANLPSYVVFELKTKEQFFD